MVGEGLKDAGDHAAWIGSRQAMIMVARSCSCQVAALLPTNGNGCVGGRGALHMLTVCTVPYKYSAGCMPSCFIDSMVIRRTI